MLCKKNSNFFYQIPNQIIINNPFITQLYLIFIYTYSTKLHDNHTLYIDNTHYFLHDYIILYLVDCIKVSLEYMTKYEKDNKTNHTYETELYKNCIIWSMNVYIEIISFESSVSKEKNDIIGQLRLNTIEVYI